MKICYLNHDIKETTGAGRFCLALTKAIKKADLGLEFDVITSEDLLSGGFLVLILKFFKIRTFFKRFDLIHALDGWPYGFIAVIASWGLGKKIIITAVGTGAIQPLHQALKKNLMVWAYKKADRVVAVSNNTKQEILKIIPVLEKISIINHGVDLDRFQASPAYWGKADSLRPYILSVGALKKRKGFYYSIRAFKEISEEFSDFKYVILGNGSEYSNLQSQISNLKLQDKVIFLEKLTEEELIGLYKNAELFILLPQNNGFDIEGFGLVFLEAAACGLPVIATHNTGAEDAILDGQNGFSVPQNEYREAAQILKKILSDKILKQDLSNKSIEFARSMDWSSVAHKYIDIYEDNIYNQFPPSCFKEYIDDGCF